MKLTRFRNRPMARFAERLAVREVEPQIGMRGPRLNMVCVKTNATNPALLAGKVVARVDGSTPSSILTAREFYLPRGFVAPIFRVSRTTSKVCGGAPVQISCAPLNAFHPFRAQDRVTHLSLRLSLPSASALLSARISQQRGQCPCARLTSALTRAQRRAEISLPFRGGVRATARTVCRRFSTPHAIVIIPLFDGEGLTAHPTRQRDFPTHRGILAGGRTCLAAPVFDLARFN